jgi:hypothetical protein
MKKKVGRPKLPANQTRAVFPIRLSKEERKQVERAAKSASQKPTEWARNQLLHAASGDIT